jgi:hypothetical protein
MKFTRGMSVAVAATMTIASPAVARSTESGDKPVITAAVTAGTLGIGPEVGVRFSDRLGVRGNATFLGFGADFDADGNAYRGDLKLKSFGAMVDVYPFGGGFRISGGARINRNRVSVKATPSGFTNIGDDSYSAAEVGILTGRADVKKFAPALTLGYGGSKRKGFMFGIETGILFQGEARLREFTATGTRANDPVFRASLERERLSLQEDIDKVKVYPILQMMIGWRF